MKWFPFQVVILHTANNINSLADHFQSFLKVFSMLKIRIWYNETIVTNSVPYYVGIKCINCEKTICCLLDNQTIEKFITPFVTKNSVPACWFILDHPVKQKRLSFYLQHHCPSWIINGLLYNTMICLWFHG